MVVTIDTLIGIFQNIATNYSAYIGKEVVFTYGTNNEFNLDDDEVPVTTGGLRLHVIWPTWVDSHPDPAYIARAYSFPMHFVEYQELPALPADTLVRLTNTQKFVDYLLQALDSDAYMNILSNITSSAKTEIKNQDNSKTGWSIVAGMTNNVYACDDIPYTPCDPVRVHNSTDTYDVTVGAGTDLVLPDIDVTQSDGTTSAYPAMEDVVCDPCVDLNDPCALNEAIPVAVRNQIPGIEARYSGKVYNPAFDVIGDVADMQQGSGPLDFFKVNCEESQLLDGTMVNFGHDWRFVSPDGSAYCEGVDGLGNPIFKLLNGTPINNTTWSSFKACLNRQDMKLWLILTSGTTIRTDLAWLGGSAPANINTDWDGRVTGTRDLREFGLTGWHVASRSELENVLCEVDPIQTLFNVALLGFIASSIATSDPYPPNRATRNYVWDSSFQLVQDLRSNQRQTHICVRI